MRKALQIMMESDPEIEVIAMARDGQEGIDSIRKLKPDCVTLDIEMPRMNGLEALDIIMKEMPLPVLMVSSLTTEGAQMTLEAMDRGAVDFIPKTQSFVAMDITKIKEDLLSKIHSVVASKLANRGVYWTAAKRRKERLQALDKKRPLSVPRTLKVKPYGLLAVGVSTGGPPVVQHLLENLEADFPVGIVVAQHMPASFTGPFAERLNRLTPLEVREAEQDDEVIKGTVLIGRGGKHLALARRSGKVIVDVSEDPAGLLYFPSVDVLYSSAVNVFGSRTLGVILTGMGKDGVIGLHEISAIGGTIVAQDEETCVVYGMPRAAVEAGIADLVVPGGDVPWIVQELVSSSK